MISSDKIVSFDWRLEKAPVPNGSSLNKVEKFKWRPLDQVGEFNWIDKQDLHVDRSYQREDEYRDKILTMASDWKWESCGAISVMQREDGRYMVVDGQNRTLAAWRRSDISRLPCMVFRSKSIEHEASSFIEINTNRKPVTAYIKFRARLVAGDQSSKEIVSIVADNGLQMRPDGAKPGTITCIAACERMYAQSPSSFARVIALAAKISAADNVFVCGILVGGLSVLDRKVQDGLQDKRLAQKLTEVGAIALVDAARKMSFRIGKGGAVVWADGMLEIINRKRGAKFTYAV